MERKRSSPVHAIIGPEGVEHFVTEDGLEVAKKDLTGYVTEQELEEELSEYAKSQDVTDEIDQKIITADYKVLKYTQIPLEVGTNKEDVPNPEVAGEKLVKITPNEQFQLHACAAKFDEFTLNKNGLTKIRQFIDDVKFRDGSGEDNGTVYYASIAQGLRRNDIDNVPQYGHSLIIVPQVYVEYDDTSNIYVCARKYQNDPFITGQPSTQWGNVIIPDDPNTTIELSNHVQIRIESGTEPDFSKENCPIRVSFDVEYTFDYAAKNVYVTIDVIVFSKYSNQKIRTRLCTDRVTTVSSNPDFISNGDTPEPTWQPIITANAYNYTKVNPRWIEDITWPLTFNNFVAGEVLYADGEYRAVFYGLSRAAGVNLASSTGETAPDGIHAGVYPAASKAAIQNLLGIKSEILDAKWVKVSEYKLGSGVGDAYTWSQFKPTLSPNKTYIVRCDMYIDSIGPQRFYGLFTCPNYNSMVRVMNIRFPIGYIDDGTGVTECDVEVQILLSGFCDAYVTDSRDRASSLPNGGNSWEGSSTNSIEIYLAEIAVGQ